LSEKRPNFSQNKKTFFEGLSSPIKKFIFKDNIREFYLACWQGVVMGANTKSKNHGERQAFHVAGAAPVPLGNYSHAVRSGNLLFVSGQGARDPKTGIEAGITHDDNGNIIAYDITAQTHAVIKNLTTVLHAAGCTLADLVDVSVFLADINDFAEFNSVYAQYFSFANPPARTTVQAAALPGKNFIEIKAIAHCPN
jgi:2-aminomuconate deaminase